MRIQQIIVCVVLFAAAGDAAGQYPPSAVVSRQDQEARLRVTSVDAETIKSLNDEYCAAYNAGDLERVLAFMAEDALTLPPDQAPVQGREAHRKYFAAGLAREFKRKLALTSIRSQRSGDLLYDSGEWTDTVTGPDGKAQTSGYYLTVYRREGGGWKAAAVTFNVKQ